MEGEQSKKNYLREDLPEADAAGVDVDEVALGIVADAAVAQC